MSTQHKPTRQRPSLDAASQVRTKRLVEAVISDDISTLVAAQPSCIDALTLFEMV